MARSFMMHARSSIQAHMVIHGGTMIKLMDQIKSAIEIFKATHPDCQALFIFDQSLVHASLPADALKAFEMIKSNGSKQHHQHDTIILDSNPNA